MERLENYSQDQESQKTFFCFHGKLKDTQQRPAPLRDVSRQVPALRSCVNLIGSLNFQTSVCWFKTSGASWVKSVAGRLTERRERQKKEEDQSRGSAFKRKGTYEACPRPHEMSRFEMFLQKF